MRDQRATATFLDDVADVDRQVELYAVPLLPPPLGPLPLDEGDHQADQAGTQMYQ